MMRKLRRLQPLIQRAQEQRDEVAREFARCVQALTDQQRRLDELQRFVRDYAAVRTGTTLSPALLANREAFRARLDEAVRAQCAQVERARSRVEGERLRLDRAVRKTRVYETLAERYRDAWQQSSLREENALLDEHGLRRACRAAGEEETP
ncbi:MAG: hypothetical protein KatS3mg126_2013 [Lysobacteraceae bacterium]|nr:MAG: hypothetical protein KatS3mg126_2013 [Xanthomonadaceae bacterium]